MAKRKLHGEYIYRFSNEFFFIPPPPLPQPPVNYPWENKYIGELPRITKDFFRCKGNELNPVIIQIREGKEAIKHYDCPGGKKHGLPLKDGKEFIYPCLIEILNYLQENTQKKVIITSGHRCPKHNMYVDYKSSNWGSKHMLGAEVDFYIQGMEYEPMQVISLIQKYYIEIQPLSSEYTHFQRFEKEGLNTATPPWYNKEIFIKLYLEHEGRTIDNLHIYPYISIQVRYDRYSDAKVIFDQQQAQNYLRH